MFYRCPPMVAAFLLMAVPAFADDAGAFKDWNEGRREDALTEWRRLAVAGDPLAQYNLATRYLKGDGVAQSRDTAIAWLRQSADGGYVRSMELLGTALMGGSGFEPHYPEALQRLTDAAQAGSIIAKNNLAVLYMDGRGTPVDLVQAHRYAEEAALATNQVATAETSPLLAAIESRMTPKQQAEAKRGPRPVPRHPVAAEESAAAPSPSVRSEPGPWLVQIASVTNRTEAEREWHRQQKRSPKLAEVAPLYVDVRLASGIQVTRIFIGGFADAESAKRFCDDLKSGGCLPTRDSGYR